MDRKILYMLSALIWLGGCGSEAGEEIPGNTQPDSSCDTSACESGICLDDNTCAPFASEGGSRTSTKMASPAPSNATATTNPMSCRSIPARKRSKLSTDLMFAGTAMAAGHTRCNRRPLWPQAIRGRFTSVSPISLHISGGLS